MTAPSNLTPEMVFVTDGFPQHTYVDPAGGQPERDLRDALGQANKIISLVGASKCGKSTLCDKFFGIKRGESKILVTGDTIASPAAFWSEAYRQLTGGKQEDYFSLSATEAVEKFAERGLPLIIDDFHYVEYEVQSKLCQQMKNAAAQGVRFVVLNIPHRGDDPIRNNKDLSGRFYSIDMGFWNNADLEEIGRKGFSALGISAEESVIQQLATEALHSPQLMQTLCLETCRALNADMAYEAQRITLESFDLEGIKTRAVKSYDQSTQFHFLKEGPTERGSKRSSFKLRDGTAGDVYDVLTRIVALNPPFVSISLDEIKGRMKAICCEGQDPNIRAALNQIKSVFKDGGDPVQWDDDKRLLVIIDPHFYFYLRCQLPNELPVEPDGQRSLPL